MKGWKEVGMQRGKEAVFIQETKPLTDSKEGGVPLANESRRLTREGAVSLRRSLHS